MVLESWPLTTLCKQIRENYIIPYLDLDSPIADRADHVVDLACRGMGVPALHVFHARLSTDVARTAQWPGGYTGYHERGAFKTLVVGHGAASALYEACCEWGPFRFKPSTGAAGMFKSGIPTSHLLHTEKLHAAAEGLDGEAGRRLYRAANNLSNATLPVYVYYEIPDGSPEDGLWGMRSLIKGRP